MLTKLGEASVLEMIDVEGEVKCFVWGSAWSVISISASWVVLVLVRGGEGTKRKEGNPPKERKKVGGGKES